MDIKELEQLNKKLDEVLINLKDLKQSNQILREELESFTINEMAQLQGNDSKFYYYTLDREPISHYPHIHICVKRGVKGWNGKNLDNGSPYIDLGAVRLCMVDEYTLDNLILEHIRDPKIQNTKYKKMFVNWLNSNYKNRPNGIKNNLKALDDYLTSNSICPEVDKYNKWLEEKLS